MLSAPTLAGIRCVLAQSFEFLVYPIRLKYYYLLTPMEVSCCAACSLKEEFYHHLCLLLTHRHSQARGVGLHLAFTKPTVPKLGQLTLHGATARCRTT
jgi:hypothetical protein